jgi:hypothetical protein
MKNKALLQSVVYRINDKIISDGKNQVIEISFEGRKVYFQLVERAVKHVSKSYLTTCGLTPARAFDWLVAFEIGVNIK